MPEERFYQEFVEKNKKSDIKNAKNKIRKRLILLALVILFGVFLLINGIQKKENSTEEIIQVKSAKSITEFEPVVLEDGTKITIKRITVKDSEGIVYLNKETAETGEENLTVSVSNINEQDDEIKIDEEGLKLKIDLNRKTVEEVKE